MFVRHPANPLITPADVPPARTDFEVIGAFNAGAVRHGEETILLLRVAERPRSGDPALIRCPYVSADGEITIEEIPRDHPDWDTSDPRKIHHRQTQRMLLTSISHLRLARSPDGVHFTIDPQPWLDAGPPYACYGVEDARITPLEGRYYVNYTAVSPLGIATGMVSTVDFDTVERHGIIFPPANRDVTIFPARVNGRYVCYHRPMPGMFGGYHIWSATSPDLHTWGDHRLVLPTQPAGWDSGRVGGGAPPLLTDHGWLAIYHAADGADRYALGAFLADPADPARIIARSRQPILTPAAAYETDGFFGNVVFTCGVVPHSDRLRVYYGASDERMALAEVALDDLLAHLLEEAHA